jgi:type IV pilus assembly protein PilA
VLQLLRRRLQGEREGGFTLIELMVVVLIIAILIAIAIPTFLGARTRAQDRAAQSNLRNALTAEKSYYTDAQAYTATPADLTAIEPSLRYNADAAPSANNEIYISVAGGAVTLGAKSASGTCFYLKDIPTGTGSGTFYARDTACPAPSARAGTVTATSW